MSGLAGRSEESRLSLAGTQGKMGLAHMPRMPMDDGRLIPVSGAASTHIIKVSPLPRIHELEATCMDAAGRCGIDVPDCWHVDLQEAQLGSTRTIDDVHPSDFAMLARDLGIGARRMRALCNELAESLDQPLMATAEQCSGESEALSDGTLDGQPGEDRSPFRQK